MLSILNVSGPRLEVNALFIQPTRWCTLNCKGCYVKEHAGGEDGYHTLWTEQYKLFQKFYNSDEAWANQITISMDNFHLDVEIVNPPGLKQKARGHMLNLFETIATDVANEKREYSPEVHMTFNSVSTLEDYWRHTLVPHNFMSNIDVLSFSHIKDIEYTKALAKQTHINYNHLIPNNVTSFNIDKHVARMIEIGEVVDSIYMVIFKSPIGRERNDLVKVGDTSRMQSDITYINTMMERLPEHIKAKINIDGCLKDTAESLRTGFGCSSNVSRFQVWPDGSVSGCAYAFSANGEIGKTAEDIMDNIRKARKRYDFRDKCHLPSVYNSVHR